MEPIQIEDLYRERGPIRRLACALVGESDADDVVQEAMTAALARDRAPLHWGRWLSGVTRHISWRRSSQRRTQRRQLERHAQEGGLADAHQSSPEQLIEEVEAKNALERAVLDLDEPYRSVVLWRYYEDVSIEEISLRCGTPQSTTRTRLVRGLERLRARMKSEQGNEWRLALAPLLMRKPSDTTFVGAAAATGVTLMTITTLKWAALASAVAAALVFLPMILGQDDGPDRTDEPVVRRSVPGDVPAIELAEQATDQRVPEQASPPVKLSARSESVAGIRRDARLVDGESGMGLAGVELELRMSFTTGALIFKRQKTHRRTVHTDADGRFSTLGPGDEQKGAPEPGSSFAEIEAQHDGPFTIPCYVEELDDGSYAYTPDVQFACRVKLPGSLSAAERAAVSYGLSIEDSNGIGEGVGLRLKPAASGASELLLLVPNHVLQGEWVQGKSVGTIAIATTPNGPSFTATFDAFPSLRDDPLEAEVSDSVIHTVRVLDARTREPVETAQVTVAPPSARNMWGAQTVSGTTDVSGKTQLMGVPAGEVAVEVRKHGYNRFRGQLTTIAGGTSDVLIEPETGLRQVTFTVRAEEGDPPLHVWCSVMGADGTTVAREAGAPERAGDGWSFELTMETVPAAHCYVRVESIGDAYDLERYWHLEPEQDELVIDVGPLREVLPMFVDAPEGAPFKFVRKVGAGRAFVSSHEGPGVVGGALTDGTPCTWVLRPRDHVPVIGTENDWVLAEIEGRRVLKIKAPFKPGWGTVVHTYRHETTDDGRGGTLPFGLRAKAPIEGVELLDGPNGRRIGVTNDRGLAVIEVDARPEAIWYRYDGQTTRRGILEGEESLEIFFR